MMDYHEDFKARELEVLHHIADGLSNKEIAEKLFIAVSTVRWHNRQLYSKLGVHSRTLAVAKARDLGLLETTLPEDASAKYSQATNTLHNMPHFPTSFIGREAQIEMANSLLSSTRLLTLTGPGGSGKTRLTIEIARSLTASFSGAIWFVPLAPIRDADLIVEAIITAIHSLRSGDVSSMEQLKSHLKQQHALLILDNFEHLMPGVMLIKELLEACEHLKIIVTSREVLRLSGEQEYPVPPLILPGGSYRSQNTIQSEAVTLFLERAKAVNPDFAPDNADTIAEICLRLDGLPLAIELAAARIRHLTLGALLSRLNKGLDVLSGGPRDAPRRQKTLNATIEWSYNLLDREEQILFSRLGIFRGAWSIEAMEAICAEDLDNDVFDLLVSLVDKSLVQQVNSSGDEPQFSVLETLKEFASSVLEPAYKIRLHQLHYDYFVNLLIVNEAKANESFDTWFDLLFSNEENLRYSLEWAENLPDSAEKIVPIASRMYSYWDLRGHLREGRKWLRVALGASSMKENKTRIKLLNSAGRLAHRQGDYEAVEEYCSQALELSEKLEESISAGIALHYLAHAAQYKDDFELAIARFERGIKLYRQVNHETGVASLSNCLGDLYCQLGNYDLAESMISKSLLHHRQYRHDRSIASVVYNLGKVFYYQNNIEDASNVFGKHFLLHSNSIMRVRLMYVEWVSSRLPWHGGK